MQKFSFRALLGAALLVGLAASQADASLLTKNDLVKFTRTGAFGGADGGGEFALYKKVGSSWEFLFKTFCIEFDEHIQLNTVFKVGGVSSQAVLGGSNTNSGDPLGLASDWLFAAYHNGTLDDVSSFQYGNNTWANALQAAFWELEDERQTSNANAQSLIDLALQKSSVSGYTAQGVQVINLFDESSDLTNFDPLDSSTWGGLGHRQDQLIFDPSNTPDNNIAAVPEPGTLAVWSLLGLVGLVGCTRARRRPAGS